MAGALILIVDNDLHTARTLAAILKLELSDIDVHTSDSALGSFERIRAIEYEAIISDINMPHKNGTGFLRAVQKLRPGTPVLFMTGHREQTAAIQALAAGAYDVIAKPIDRNACLIAVRHALEAYRLKCQLRTQAGTLLDTLKEAMGDLEVLYGAYGLRSHFEAILQTSYNHLLTPATSNCETPQRGPVEVLERLHEQTERRSSGQPDNFPLSDCC